MSFENHEGNDFLVTEPKTANSDPEFFHLCMVFPQGWSENEKQKINFSNIETVSVFLLFQPNMV